MKATGLVFTQTALASDRDMADITAYWRQEQASARGHRVMVLGPGASYTPLPATVCSYCQTHPGDSDRCRNCGAPA